jgi:hypothetical protein
MSSSVFHIGPHVVTAEDLPSRAGIRWAVGSPDGRRSSTWRLWGDKKGDVYLSMRSQGGRLKASFHRDRHCSVGFTKEYESIAKERFGADSRHWERWRLPAPEAPSSYQYSLQSLRTNSIGQDLNPMGSSWASCIRRAVSLGQCTQLRPSILQR